MVEKIILVVTNLGISYIILYILTTSEANVPIRDVVGIKLKDDV